MGRHIIFVSTLFVLLLLFYFVVSDSIITYFMCLLMCVCLCVLLCVFSLHRDVNTSHLTCERSQLGKQQFGVIASCPLGICLLVCDAANFEYVFMIVLVSFGSLSGFMQIPPQLVWNLRNLVEHTVLCGSYQHGTHFYTIQSLCV